jgi:pimeloyl-ACP methyl ester carboxylesterase
VGDVTSPPPAWFTRAITAPFTEHTATAGGLPVHYLRWGAASGKPPVVLIHGGGAHAFWWAFLAPLLADPYDVVALDLTGHGDSGRRERYPREVWAEDVLAVIDHAAFGSRPVLVGHSMGGFVSVVMAALHGEKLSGAILVDAPVRPPRPESEPRAPERSGWSFERMAPYPDRASAVARFRLLPEQPSPHPYLQEYVAERSVRHDPDGYTWKFDPRVFERASTSSLRDYLAAAKTRLAIVRGEESVVLPRETADYMVSLGGGSIPLVEIPGGHHHLMFDQPLALLVALRALLGAWAAAS